MHDVAEALSAWNSFYVMVGSSSAALTGLMFVVITLVDEKQSPTEEGLSTFSTPNVFHFCCVLFTSAFMAAPFRSLLPVIVFSSIAGAAGICYVGRIALLTMRLRAYRADLEDWVWHVVLPLAAYGTLLIGALTLHDDASLALYAPGAAVTLLIFVGIHNAWDVVTYLALGRAGATPQDAATNAVTAETRN